VEFCTELIIRFDYGRTIPWVNRRADGTLTAIAGPDLLALHTPVEIEGQDMHSVGRFVVNAGETVPFVLSHTDSTATVPSAIDAQTLLQRTQSFWRGFVANCPSVDPWSSEVRRSLITLKALTFEPTGGIVAAATTSLPEWIGGERNWDYRFCWLRDATFTLLAFMNLGYYEEASKWRDWLMRAIAGSPSQMQIMYGLAGERRLNEAVIPWLAGYEGSKPVRIGNAAAEQLQLDVYGEVADALYHGIHGGLTPHARTREIGRAMLDHLERVWQLPDEGIWEIRGPRRHFTHSKVMAWTAFDRAAKLSEMIDGPNEQASRWNAIGATIHEEICRRGFDPDLDSFVQAYGSKHLDASLLLLPLVGFLPPQDSRILGTVRAIERTLMRDGLVMRYHTGETDDGLPPGEGAFLACSFWLANVYAQQGRLADGRRLFQDLLGLANDVGLFAEEYDPRSGRQLGNFPQAFSHVGLINTALALSGQERERRSDRDVS
jgi:GH15 family glucan-1,4-alpha-glucosidase